MVYCAFRTHQAGRVAATIIAGQHQDLLDELSVSTKRVESLRPGHSRAEVIVSPTPFRTHQAGRDRGNSSRQSQVLCSLPAFRTHQAGRAAAATSATSSRLWDLICFLYSLSGSSRCGTRPFFSEALRWYHFQSPQSGEYAFVKVLLLPP